jgi:branched-chain amino acid transport system permease protein
MEVILDVLTNPYYIQVMTMVGISLIAALGLHLITGITGQFSFGHAAFVMIKNFTGKQTLQVTSQLLFLPNP